MSLGALDYVAAAQLQMLRLRTAVTQFGQRQQLERREWCELGNSIYVDYRA